MIARFDFIKVPGAAPTDFSQAIEDGLSSNPKSLPTRFLYDTRGSHLFEVITELPEYYLTRAERQILELYADEMVVGLGENAMLVEFGSGSSVKTQLLIQAFLKVQPNLSYVPVDISADFLQSSAQRLLGKYPELSVLALGGEYFDVAANLPSHGGPRLILFMGSNIGNLTHEESAEFLTKIRSGMTDEDRILIGFDLIKDRKVIEEAYDDHQGVTAEFNRNLLQRVNEQLGADFNLLQFRHEAPYDPIEDRIEMRLISCVDQVVSVAGLGRRFHFAEGEAIHTEWSHKYSLESIDKIVQAAGLKRGKTWQDPLSQFSVAIFEPHGP